MELPKAPQDIELKNIIDKLAQFVARNGPDFEQMTKSKQKGNSKFAFLFGGEYYQYYQYKVQSEQARLHTSSASPQPVNMIPTNPAGLAVWNMLQQQQQQSTTPMQHPVSTVASTLLQPNVASIQQQVAAAAIQQQAAAVALAQQVAAVALSQQVATAFPQNLSVEAIKQQQASLQEQTSQSEQNLNAQHVALLQQQQVAIEEAIRKAETERLHKDADSLGINFNEFNVILQPIIDTCTKDSISNGKAWILQKATSKQATNTLVLYLLQKVIESEKKFHQRLHIIYLVNDILHHCSRKHITEFMQALENVVVPMFCLTSLGVTEEQQGKLTKLLNIWESKNNYFNSEIVVKLKDPVTSWQEYKDALQVKYPDIVNRFTSQTKTTFQGFQAQHVAFVHHTLQQIQSLEHQKQQLEEVQKQQAAAAVAAVIPPPPPIPPSEAVPPDDDSEDEDGPPGVDRSELEGRYRDRDKYSHEKDEFGRDVRERDNYRNRENREDYDRERDRDKDVERDQFGRDKDRDYRERERYNREDREHDRDREYSRDRDRDDRRDSFNNRDGYSNRDNPSKNDSYTENMNRDNQYNQSFNEFNNRDNYNSFISSRDFNDSRDFSREFGQNNRDFASNRDQFNNGREFSGNRDWSKDVLEPPPPPSITPGSNNVMFPDLGINLTQPPPGFNVFTPPPNIELPDVTRPPPGFPPVLPPQQPDFQPEDLLPSLPYYDLPAGLMVPLVKLEETRYRPLNPEDIRLPPPAPPSERLLAAVKAFYSPPDHDHPRDSEGWEKLGLYEYFKAKSTAKKNKEVELMKGLRDLSRSPTPVRSFFCGDKTPPPKRRYSSRSRSKSRERSAGSRRRSGRRDRERSPRPTQERPAPPSLLNMPLLAPPPGHPDYRRTPSPPLFGGAGLGSGGKTEAVEERLGESNKGHQLLKKMGWSGAGLGANEQGIEAPISSGEVREKADQYKGVGININDPYENFRKSKGQAFITRMKARAEERVGRAAEERAVRAVEERLSS